MMFRNEFVPIKHFLFHSQVSETLYKFFMNISNSQYPLQAYFGGTVECEAQAEGDDKFDPKDLVCGGCSNKERDQACH